MGWWRAAVEVGRRMLGMPAPGYVFDSTPQPIADLLAELNSATTARVTRDAAMSVSAVQRGRNEVCSLATLPIRLYRGLDVLEHPLFRQFDPDVSNVVHVANTIEDLVFEKTAWWLITGQDFEGYPTSVRYVPVGKVSIEPPKKDTPPPGRWVWIDGVRYPMSQVIRFDSPNPAVLVANARAIRCAILLEGLALTYADNPRPLDYFTDTTDPNVEPFSDDQWRSFLARWRFDRKRSGTARVPGQVTRVDVNAPSPAELQLVELKRQVTLEIANGLGVDPEDLGVSTTSRTYFNAQDRRISKINEGRRPIMKAITDRLSMGDVTRRGNTVAFDLTEYLEADPASQATYWRSLLDMGVTDANEIRGWAKLPGRAPGVTAAPAALPAGATAARPPLQIGDVTPRGYAGRFADQPAGFTFDRVDFADAPAAPTVDAAARTITGLAVPYGAVARKFGMGFRFLPGSLEYGANVKHFKDHVTPVGLMTSLTEASEGPTVTLSVLTGPAGGPHPERDQLLFDAEQGLYNGLSIGVDFNLEDPADATYHDGDDVWDIHRATLREVSTTSMPAFDDARVTQVAASMTGGFPVFCTHCGQQHVPGVACSTHAQRVQAANAAQFTTPGGPAQPAPAPAPTPTGPPVPAPPGADQATFDAWLGFQQAQQRVGTLAGPAAAREFVNAASTAVARVTEPSPYRFDRKGNLRKGSHDFLTDLQAGWGDGDAGARDRVQSFVNEAFSDGSALGNLMIQKANEDGNFAVTSGNVGALNPNRNRPDMYVDQMEYDYPIWDAIDKGTLEDITPFVVPKYNSSSGLVANHVEGTEPTPGAFTATAQTITPSAVSGKVEYTREAWDQGGNPQASGLIWTQMVRGYYEALEAYAVSSLVAVAASLPDITITTAAADAALDQALADAIVPLNYIRGGNRFQTAYTQIDLYKALAKAKDTAGRRLYPEIGPQNAMGTTDAGYRAIRAHGVNWLPAWALAATGIVAASSYMFDRSKVCGWATAPQRIDITWRVAWVDIGIWGYKAFAVTDFAGTREVVYDPA